MSGLNRAQILPEPELPDVDELLVEGRRLARTAAVGPCPFLMQFHRINLNMLLWPWTDSPQVVGDRVKNVARQAICAASGGD